MKQIKVWVIERQLKHADVHLKFELDFMLTVDAAIRTEAVSLPVINGNASLGCCLFGRAQG